LAICRGRASRSRNEGELDTKSREHDIVVSGIPMKNVTVTLDDTIANRADAEAASQGKSLSKFVSELIERAVGPDIGRGSTTDLEAMEKFLSGPGIPATSDCDRLPNRQELYDERINELVRRYERSNLRD
jgi:hypothetical protein